MTFLRYSKFTSSSVLTDVVLGAGELDLERVSAGDGEEIEWRGSDPLPEPLNVSFVRAVQ